MADTLDKALKQLSKVEMTYRRLALYDKQEGVLPYTEMLLSISEVVDYVLSEFPESERNRIAENRQEKLPYLRGDLFQLTFCLEAILSFLLRYLPLDEKIDFRVFSEEGWVIMKLSGFLPPDRGPEEFAAQKALSETIMQMALGDEVIRDSSSITTRENSTTGIAERDLKEFFGSICQLPERRHEHAGAERVAQSRAL